MRNPKAFLFLLPIVAILLVSVVVDFSHKDTDTTQGQSVEMTGGHFENAPQPPVGPKRLESSISGSAGQCALETSDGCLVSFDVVGIESEHSFSMGNGTYSVDGVTCTMQQSMKRSAGGLYCVNK